MNILICDDMHDDGLKLLQAIESSGIEADCCYFDSGADALSHIKTGAKADLCFLDIIMPEMTGIELARHIRKMETAEGTKAREIVFLTTSNEFASESFEVKAFSYLLKPPDPHKVAHILDEIINLEKTSDKSGIPITTKTMTKFLYFRDISYFVLCNHQRA